MIVSIHEYTLDETATTREFEAVIAEAKQRRLFNFPGLSEVKFLQGIKGDRVNKYTAIWLYESRNAWENLWGPVGNPKSKDEYPKRWREWEDELLAPILAADPDDVQFTSYRVLANLE